MIDTTTGRAVVPKNITVYYKAGYNANPPESIQEFPRGLRMIAGNPTGVTAPPSWMKIFKFWCERGPAQEGQRIPVCEAFSDGNEMALSLDFPNCWNGRDLDSPDHRSHMDYSLGGACPASHPVALPQISYNVWYPVPAGQTTARWLLSSDMGPSGYSMHGDWVDGWDAGINRDWLNNCVRTRRDCGSNAIGDGRVLVELP